MTRRTPLTLSRRDVEFLLFEWLCVDTLTKRHRYAEHDRTTLSAALDVYQRIAEEVFAPHNRSNDLNEPRVEDGVVHTNPPIAEALRKFRAAGLMVASQGPEFDGMRLPVVVERAGFAWLKAANPATSVYPYLAIANANLLIAHGSPEQVERYARPILEGRFLGTMCLSEPQAGSSLGDIKTLARPQSDGTHRLFGSKMWISAADHDLSENIIHLVLARITGAPAGVGGLSLFLVPKYLVSSDGSRGEKNDLTVVALNHKMGYRGTVNCAFNFGDGGATPGGQQGAVGYLVGEPGRGLGYMFHMMNEARIAVGIGAAALGYAGYLQSLGYARDRLQGRRRENREPDSSQVAIIAHADVRRMLLAQKAYAEGALALNLYCARQVDETISAESEAGRYRASLLLDLLTPVAKGWSSQWCVEANNLAIQVHGGYGYTRDFAVEQLYRDNRLNPIHEGTNGIQAIDLLERKVVMVGGVAFQILLDEIKNSIFEAGCASNEIVEGCADTLGGALELLQQTTNALSAKEPADVTRACASVYLEAFGHIVVAWMWLMQATVAAKSTGEFYIGKIQAARYFFEWEVPKAKLQLQQLSTIDPAWRHMEESWF